MVGIAVVPVKNERHLTESIVADLVADPALQAVLVLDNGSTDGTVGWLRSVARDHPRLVVVEEPDAGIYDLWDYGRRWALRNWGPATGPIDRPVYLHVLNNDVTLAPGTLSDLTDALEVRPDAWVASPDPDAPWPDVGLRRRPVEVRGSYRHGGMLGYAFTVAVHRWPVGEALVDPAFSWWYGDDDLAFSVEARGGKILRVKGLPIAHETSSTARHHPELAAVIDQDRETFVAKWGDR